MARHGCRSRKMDVLAAREHLEKLKRHGAPEKDLEEAQRALQSAHEARFDRITQTRERILALEAKLKDSPDKHTEDQLLRERLRSSVLDLIAFLYEKLTSTNIDNTVNTRRTSILRSKLRLVIRRPTYHLVTRITEGRTNRMHARLCPILLSIQTVVALVSSTGPTTKTITMNLKFPRGRGITDRRVGIYAVIRNPDGRRPPPRAL
ncbi:hypothetical protein JCM8202v2_001857 [Rhodotorula sphaerocarpa]